MAFLGRFHPRAGLVASRQRFVHCCHRGWDWIYFAFGLVLLPETAQRPRLHWRTSLISRFHASWVGLPALRVLLLRAKHLFVAANTVLDGLQGIMRRVQIRLPCKGKTLRCLRKCRFIDTSPALSARRDLPARFALFSFSAPSTAAFSSHLGCQTHQTYYFTHLQSRPRRGSPVAHTRFKTLIYLKGFGVGP